MDAWRRLDPSWEKPRTDPLPTRTDEHAVGGGGGRRGPSSTGNGKEAGVSDTGRRPPGVPPLRGTNDMGSLIDRSPERTPAFMLVPKRTKYLLLRPRYSVDRTSDRRGTGPSLARSCEKVRDPLRQPRGREGRSVQAGRAPGRLRSKFEDTPVRGRMLTNQKTGSWAELSNAAT